MNFEEWLKRNPNTDRLTWEEDLQKAWNAAINEAVKTIENEYIGVSEQYEQDGFDLVNKIKELKE